MDRMVMTPLRQPEHFNNKKSVNCELYSIQSDVSIWFLPMTKAAQVGTRNEQQVIDTSDPSTELQTYGTYIFPRNSR